MAKLHLYVGAGTMMKDSSIEVLPCCLLAKNEHEANGSHVKWMMEKFPGYALTTLNLIQIPDELVLQAAEELK